MPSDAVRTPASNLTDQACDLGTRKPRPEARNLSGAWNRSHQLNPDRTQVIRKAPAARERLYLAHHFLHQCLGRKICVL